MECSVEEFHEIRYNVARVLREVQVLDKRYNTRVSDRQKQLFKNMGRVLKIKKMAKISGVGKLKFKKKLEEVRKKREAQKKKKAQQS